MVRFRVALFPDPAAARLIVRVAGAVALAAAGFLGFAWYDSAVLGLPPLGEMPPLFSLYHLARSAFALLASALIVGLVWRGRSEGSAFASRSIEPAGHKAAWLVLALAAASSLLFLADVGAFARFAQEDGPVEWPSTFLLLAGSLLFAAAAVRLRTSDRIGAMLAILFVLLLFVMAMEEISWMQRVVGFATPDELKRVNWQGEFNLHNVQTDLTENVYYVGAAGLLIGLPLLADALPPGAMPTWLARFVPGRWVAAASAPLSLFNYGMWNVVPMQMTFFVTVLAMLAWSRAAAGRGDRSESQLFAAIAAAVAAGQAAFLLEGHLMPDIWDASEYKELFIALGLACWAFGVAVKGGRQETAVRA